MSEGDWIHPTRTISTNVLLFCNKGDVHIEIDREFSVLHPGEVMILPAYLLHRGTQTSRDVSYYWLHFVSADDIEEENPVALTSKVSIPRQLNLLQPGKVSVLISLLLDTQENTINDPEYLDLLLNSILHELQVQYNTQMRGAESPINAPIFSMMEWIRIHLNRPFNLDEMATRFSYNKSYLCRFFKSVTGESIIEYTNRMRISKVKWYLLSSDAPIKEIALRCGFRDEKYLMRLFRKYSLMTPTEYRSAFSRKHMNIK